MGLSRFDTRIEQDTQPGADIAHAEVSDKSPKKELCKADSLKQADRKSVV